MLRVRNDNLSATLEAFLRSPIPWDGSNLRSIAKLALEKFGKYNLRANQVRQRVGDLLFDYDLSFFLFNFQAQVRFQSDRLFVNVQNARGKQDAEILVDTLIRAAECLGPDAIERFSFQAMSHAAFDAEVGGQGFFAAFVDPANHITEGGRILAVQHDGWPAPVRVIVEKSLVVKDGAFLTWFTEQTGPIALEAFKQIADKFVISARSLGLEFGFE